MSAVPSREAVRLDIGTDRARTHLGSGWSYDERNRGSATTFAWSTGPSSEIHFHLGWTRDLTVEFTCRPFQYPSARTQTLSFTLNGKAIGKPIELGPSMESHGIRLPAAAQVVGRNRLVARYGRADTPADVATNSTDHRELGVAWSEIRFNGTDPTTMESADGMISIPAGAWIDYYLDLIPDSSLDIDLCNPMGTAQSLIEISVLGEFDDQPQTFSSVCEHQSLTFPLGKRNGLTRIRLSTRPSLATDTPSGIQLHTSRVLSPPVNEPPREFKTVIDEPATPHPNVIIYLVDALRADRLGVYGCERPTSPRLDAFAAEGVTFTDVVAQSSWTKAAVASIFTGLWPRAHGVNGPDDRLPDELRTLPEVFQAAGYQTGAVVANAYVGRPFGFARGFDDFEFIEHTRGRSDIIHEQVSAWLDTRVDTTEPFFLYVHTIDPHAPYTPPSPYLETFASSVENPTVGEVETVRGLVLGTVEPTEELGRDLRNLYDGEVAANDASFGRLIDKLADLGELDNTIVVFTSDHGEAFGEHGSWTHGLDLYNEVLSIPLVIRLPQAAGAGQRVTTPVQHIDLLPTMSRLCSIEVPSDLPGTTLVDSSGVVNVGTDRTIFAFLDYWGKTGATALRDGWKLIEPLSVEFSPKSELFHHGEDPFEAQDLASRSPVRSGWLSAQLAVALRGEGVSLTADVDLETREQLEALGYMHSP